MLDMEPRLRHALMDGLRRLIDAESDRSRRGGKG